MQLHSLLNSSSSVKQMPITFPMADYTASGEPLPKPKPAKAPASRTTTGTFITPQSLMAFPFASGLVAGIWQATNALGIHDHNYIGFLISLFVGAVVYGITISDPRLKTTRSERLVGVGIGLINCFYLFMAALGLHQASHLYPH